MSTTYNTEPPPTASVTLHTTAGPITFSLFASQAPLACRNFLQHILDGYYNSTVFHRVVPGFVVQGGDPTGTGEGGSTIYDDAEFEYNADGEKVVFGDELHSRLHFNRRGLLGMAKMTDAQGRGSYGSQFFITLADCRAELDGKCTMFGRVEGDGIYNVVKIAEGEVVEGTERPIWPVTVTGAEVGELPKGQIWEGMAKREKVATVKSTGNAEVGGLKKKTKKKGGKVLLSFGGEDGEDDGPVVIRKAKFNTSLIENEGKTVAPSEKINGSATKQEKHAPKKSSRVRLSTSPSPSPAPEAFKPAHQRKPSFHNPTTQLPLRDPESPSPSPSPEPTSRPSLLSQTNAEIAALKASMRRDVASVAEPKKKKSALEQMIPESSIRGRKRRHDGGLTGDRNDTDAMKMMNAFKARLDGAKPSTTKSKQSRSNQNAGSFENDVSEAEADDSEAKLCDLHFIANCQSCNAWDKSQNDDTSAGPAGAQIGDDEDGEWMTHALSFEKDRLGKDLTWRRKGEEELVVIDPREKDRELKEARKGAREKGKDREWGGRGR